jgi:anti-anti-sigma regulatory factor
MLMVNRDSIGEAGIVECEGTIMVAEDALQLRHAVTGQPSMRVIVIDFSKVIVVAAEGLSTLLFLQRWARQRRIQLKLFNPRPSVRRDLEDASSISSFEFASLGEVMAIMVDGGNCHSLAA